MRHKKISSIISIHGRPAYDPCGGGGGVVVAQGGTRGLLVLGVKFQLLHTDWKHQAFSVACSERVHCANAFRMCSSNLSHAVECARMSVALLAGIVRLPEGCSAESMI